MIEYAKWSDTYSVAKKSQRVVYPCRICKYCNSFPFHRRKRRSITSACRGSPSADRSITSAAKSNAFSAKSITSISKSITFIYNDNRDNFGQLSFSCSLVVLVVFFIIFAIYLIRSLNGRSAQCLCAFPIVTSFRERSLRGHLRGHYRPPPYRYATSLPEREGKYYRRVIVIPTPPTRGGIPACWQGGGRDL